MKKLKNNYIGLLFFVFAFLLYANTIPNDYCLDDDYVTRGDALVAQGVKAIPGLFTSFYREQQGFTYGYRPVVKATYAIEYSCFGWNPHLSHGINALLYALLILVVFLVSKKIFSPSFALLPVLSTLLFAVHPAHTEIVASLKNRDELLSVLLGFAGIMFFLKSLDGHKIRRVLLGCLMILLGLLSKLSILPLVVIIPMILYYKRSPGKGNIKRMPSKERLRDFLSFPKIKKRLLKPPFYAWIILALLLVAGIYSVLSSALPSTNGGGKEEYNLLYWQNPLYYTTKYFPHVVAAGATLWFYLKLMIFPFTLGFYYGFNMISLDASNPLTWISLVIHTCALILALWLFVKSRNTGAFAFLFYVISLSMYSNLFVPVAGIVAERLSFLASWGFCVLLAYVVLRLVKIDPDNEKGSQKKRVLIFLITALFVVPFTIRTVSRNADWKNHMTLFSADIGHLRESAKANDLMAAACFREAQIKMSRNQQDPGVMDLIKKSELYYRQSATVYPEHFMTWNNLGIIHLSYLKNFPEAVKDFDLVTRYNPDYPQGWSNLAYARFLTGDLNGSIAAYVKVTKMQPDSLGPWSSLANVYFRAGDTANAKKINEYLIRTHPESPVPYNNLATYFLAKKDTAAAIRFFNMALLKDPGNTNASSFLSYYNNMHNKKKDIPPAQIPSHEK